MFTADDHNLFYLPSLRLLSVLSVPPHLKVHVHGKGAVASMYRALMTSFDPMADKGGSKLDAAKCIPIPSVPNIAVYEEIGTSNKRKMVS